MFSISFKKQRKENNEQRNYNNFCLVELQRNDFQPISAFSLDYFPINCHLMGSPEVFFFFLLLDLKFPDSLEMAKMTNH